MRGLIPPPSTNTFVPVMGTSLFGILDVKLRLNNVMQGWLWGL